MVNTLEALKALAAEERAKSLALTSGFAQSQGLFTTLGAVTDSPGMAEAVSAVEAARANLAKIPTLTEFIPLPTPTVIPLPLPPQQMLMADVRDELNHEGRTVC